MGGDCRKRLGVLKTYKVALVKSFFLLLKNRTSGEVLFCYSYISANVAIKPINEKTAVSGIATIVQILPALEKPLSPKP